MDTNAVFSWAYDSMLLIALLVLIGSVVVPKRIGRYAAAAGWVLFGLYWALQTPFYFQHEHNVMYTVACLLALPATLYAAFVLVRHGRESLMTLTRCAAIASVFYFPFQYIPALNQWLIEATANVTFAAVSALGQPAARGFSLNGYDDIIVLHGQQVQIILACTAIQSMAIFVGVTGGPILQAVGQSLGTAGGLRATVLHNWKRWLAGLALAVPLIYALNLVRNVFVIVAFGNDWFQILPDVVAGWTGNPGPYTSFFWAHNVFAEGGSLVALVLISYAVMSLMPELLTHLVDILDLVRPENVRRMLKGEEVPAKPVPTVK